MATREQSDELWRRDVTRNAIIEECAKIAEAIDRRGREWVADSLWDNISRETAARIRKLKSKTI